MNNVLCSLSACLFLALSPSSFAQVSRGGAPFWNTPGTSISNPAWPVHRMPAIDLEEIRSADAVTDPVKSAPWRFGEEFAVDISLTDGQWLNINGTAVWRTQIQAPGAIGHEPLFF